MNYKHGRYIRNREKKTIRTNIGEVETIYCKTFGCGRKLKPTELLYGEYCFTCAAFRNQKERERLKLCRPGVQYFALKFHWDANRNLWDAIKIIQLTEQQFTLYIHSEDFSNYKTEVFYRYDIKVDTLVIDTIYSYNPNLYD